MLCHLAFTSTPKSIINFTMSKWRLSAAGCNGVRPSLSLAFTSHLNCFTNNSTASKFPLLADKCKGVLLNTSLTFTSALNSVRSIFEMLKCSFSALKCNAVRPLSSFRLISGFSFCRINLTISMFSSLAARCKVSSGCEGAGLEISSKLNIKQTICVR